MVQDQARVGDVGVEQFILPAAVVQIAVVDLAVLVDVIVQRKFGFAERLAVHDDVVGFESHRFFGWRTIAKWRKDVNGVLEKR